MLDKVTRPLGAYVCNFVVIVAGRERISAIGSGVTKLARTETEVDPMID